MQTRLRCTLSIFMGKKKKKKPRVSGGGASVNVTSDKRRNMENSLQFTR